MTPQLRSVKYLDGYRLHLTFADGKAGTIDLTDELWGEVFKPLKDLSLFQRFRLNKELNTITWPTGADLAPEFLYQRVVDEPAAAPAEARGRRSTRRPAPKKRASRM